MDRGQSWSDRRVGGGTTILGRLPRGSYSRIYVWQKVKLIRRNWEGHCFEIFQFMFDIPIFHYIASLGIPVSHRALVQRPTTKGVSLDCHFPVCNGSYSKSRTLALQKLSDWLIQVSKYWNLYPHASRRYQKLPWLLLPTYFTSLRTNVKQPTWP